MNISLFKSLLMGRGASSRLAQRITDNFSDLQSLLNVETSRLREIFSESEFEEIRKLKVRREIPQSIVQRLIEECELKCCLCWNIDVDTGVIIHHINSHASSLDDSYENLIVLCLDHHSKVHTTWELARHPLPPDLLKRRKLEFVGAIAAFKEGKRAAPGRENDLVSGVMVMPPLPPTHFVGRENCVREIENYLLSENNRVAVIGMGGIGKTAIALKIAGELKDDFHGGILWAEASADVAGIQQLVRVWIKSLGHDVCGLELTEQFALMLELLKKRIDSIGNLLLILENANEKTLPDLVTLISYIPPRTSILITTRETTVAAALGFIQIPIEPLERSASLQLLKTTSMSPLVVEGPGIEKLLALLGDLPLAVELVARQISVRERKPGFSIESLCLRLEHFNTELLSFPGHRGVALSFMLSFEGLDEREKDIFRTLGVFATEKLYLDSISVVGASEMEEVESILDRFVSISILKWGDRTHEYEMHPLLHKYATFLLLDVDEPIMKGMIGRFSGYYCSIANSIAASTPRDIASIDAIFNNLVKAIQLSAKNGNHMTVAETMLSLCAKMQYFLMRNLEEMSMPMLNLAVNSAFLLKDKDLEGALISHLATACQRLGFLDQSITKYEEAIQIARSTGNDYDLACGLQNLANSLLSEGQDLPRAERCLHEALDAATRSQNSDAAIGCLSALGYLHRESGNLNEAVRLYEGALEASKLAGNRLAEGNSLSNLGLVYEHLGDLQKAEKMILEALTISEEVEDKRGKGNRIGHLGTILISKARDMPLGPERVKVLEGAREHITNAMNIAIETRDQEKAIIWRMNLGNFHALSGNDPEAINFYEDALNLSLNGGFKRIEAQVSYNLGTALIRAGNFRLALQFFRSAGSLLKEMKSPMLHQVEFYISQLNEVLRSDRGK